MIIGWRPEERGSPLADYNFHDCQNVEHIYHCRHPKRHNGRKFLPGVVLACRRCNNERGAPGAKVFDVCPAVTAEKGMKG